MASGARYMLKIEMSRIKLTWIHHMVVSDWLGVVIDRCDNIRSHPGKKKKTDWLDGVVDKPEDQYDLRVI